MPREREFREAAARGPDLPVLRVAGAGPERRVLLDRPSFSIGRGQDCDLVLADPDRIVSTRHAVIELGRDGLWISDESTNGTYLNGSDKPLPRGARQSLRIGDRLRIGRFTLSIDTGPAPTAGVAPGSSPNWPDEQGNGLAAFFQNDKPAPAARPPVATGGNGAAAGDPLAHLDTLLDGLTESRSTSSADPRLPNFDTASAPQTPPFAGEPQAAVIQPQAAPLADEAILGAIAKELGAEERKAAPATWPASEREPPARRMGSSAGDPAMVALASFWCGLGIMPSKLDADSLTEVMGELGTALRTLCDGMAARLEPLDRARLAETNGLVSGHAGLRRYVNGDTRVDKPLDEAVMEVVAATAPDGRIPPAVAFAALRSALASLSPGALENLFRPMLKRHAFGARQRDLWLMFENMEESLRELAELRFRQEIERLSGVEGDSSRGRSRP